MKDNINTLIGGFKNFLLRGNAIDLAVGVVIGASFGSVINALAKGILTPLVSAIVRVPDMSNLSFTVNGSTFLYGELISATISFILVAISIYFFVIFPMSLVANKVAKKEVTEPTTKTCPECKSDISIDAKRCAFCTQVLI